MRFSSGNHSADWIKDTLSVFSQIRRQGTPSNIMDVVLKFAPDLQEAIDQEEHWTSVANQTKDPTDLAIQESAKVLREGVATLWKLAMGEGAFFEIRSACVAQPRTYELLYPHCSKQEWINELFLTEKAAGDIELRASLIAPNTYSDEVGFVHYLNTRNSRGGFSVYVPENYRPESSYPLVVSLHGGSGHGRGQAWIWLKEARSNGVAILCPTSLDSTWNLGNPDADSENILHHLDEVAQKWSVDTSRLMLHGISDGGTFALASGLMESSMFTHLVPCFPSFHPMLIEMSTHSRLKAVRIYLVHGALDWMFPVEGAREAYYALSCAGVDIVYREIEDLSHSYPDDENERILHWYQE
ncbi:MAG: phospholipase [Gammaproteobacteria bacterium]|nr:phospholipase [Gammaproteobacteria bacterium]